MSGFLGIAWHLYRRPLDQFAKTGCQINTFQPHATCTNLVLQGLSRSIEFTDPTLNQADHFGIARGGRNGWPGSIWEWSGCPWDVLVFFLHFPFSFLVSRTLHNFQDTVNAPLNQSWFGIWNSILTCIGGGIRCYVFTGNWKEKSKLDMLHSVLHSNHGRAGASHILRQ